MAVLSPSLPRLSSLALLLLLLLLRPSVLPLPPTLPPPVFPLIPSLDPCAHGSTTANAFIPFRESESCAGRHTHGIFDGIDRRLDRRTCIFRGRFECAHRRDCGRCCRGRNACRAGGAHLEILGSRDQAHREAQTQGSGEPHSSCLSNFFFLFFLFLFIIVIV